MMYGVPFFDKKRVDPATGCWLWLACKFRNGYGCVRIAKKSRLAHRVAYEMVNGPIPDGAYILHSCDVPACINPAHLRIGDQNENQKEARTKGRLTKGRQPREQVTAPGHWTRVRPGSVIRGSAHVMAKLSEAGVMAIRAGYAEGKTMKELAEQYGVSRSLVSGILSGRKWGHM
jgi:hypothetical protein